MVEGITDADAIAVLRIVRALVMGEKPEVIRKSPAWKWEQIQLRINDKEGK